MYYVRQWYWFSDGDGEQRGWWCGLVAREDIADLFFDQHLVAIKVEGVCYWLDEDGSWFVPGYDYDAEDYE